ncbi:hypothetical protein C8R47DRAFT_1147642 [Mycena vitilis]|nr:hypothetical protein C8R47DRAFT_1147642 [Mycena vitilis]
MRKALTKKEVQLMKLRWERRGRTEIHDGAGGEATRGSRIGEGRGGRKGSALKKGEHENGWQQAESEGIGWVREKGRGNRKQVGQNRVIDTVRIARVSVNRTAGSKRAGRGDPQASTDRVSWRRGLQTLACYGNAQVTTQRERDGCSGGFCGRDTSANTHTGAALKHNLRFTVGPWCGGEGGIRSREGIERLEEAKRLKAVEHAPWYH